MEGSDMRLVEVSQRKGEDDSSRNSDSMYKTADERKIEFQEMRPSAVVCKARQETAK